ncbi:hypothetical protein RA11412_2705 [Rothia aeria]|uniref:Uncharacterized protein n=1 Tax=Rothia aeria TaxID=172042 RepID=A0A2Z5R356_9MICC|nr:hypothetical protein RA11412_2705 [Rothia aeria]
MEPDEFGRIIELEDTIEESDIFTRYSEYIDRVIEFTERSVIPLSEQPEVLRECVGYTRAYRCGSIDAADLERRRLELMKKPYAQKQEEAIAAYMDFLLWFEFLDGTTPNGSRIAIPPTCWMACTRYSTVWRCVRNCTHTLWAQGQ